MQKIKLNNAIYGINFFLIATLIWIITKPGDNKGYFRGIILGSVTSGCELLKNKFIDQNQAKALFVGTRESIISSSGEKNLYKFEENNVLADLPKYFPNCPINILLPKQSLEEKN